MRSEQTPNFERTGTDLKRNPACRLLWTFFSWFFNYFIACTEKQPRKESLEKIEHGCRSADLVVRTVLLYDAFCKVVSLFLESRDDS